MAVPEAGPAARRPTGVIMGQVVAESPGWAAGSFLDSMGPQAQKSLLELGVMRQLETGRVLLREGDLNNHVEILIRGFVKITTVVEGLETLLAIRVPGDIVGETATLTGGPRTATVTTCGPVTSRVISQADFRRFLQRHPEAALNMAATMGERLRWANQRRADFAAYPAEVRLARMLVHLATTCGQRTPDGVVIGVMLSQPELATMIGIAEATVQKAMRDLRRQGLISTGYRRITVVDLEALRAVGDNVE